MNHYILFCLLLPLIFVRLVVGKASESEASFVLGESRAMTTNKVQAHAEVRGLLDQVAETVRSLKIDEAFLVLEEIDSVLDQFPEESLLCEADTSRAIAHLHKNQLFLALESAEKGRLVAVKLDRTDLLMPITSTMGAIFLKLRKYDDAIAKLQESYEYARSAGDKTTLLSSINSLAICYWRLKDWKLSEKYLRLALLELSEKGSVYYLIKGNIGLILTEQGQYEEAEVLLTDVYDYYHKHNTIFAMGLLAGNLADLEVRKGNFEKAIGLAHQSLDFGETIKNQYVLTRSYRHLGNALIGTGEQEKATDALLQSLEYASAMDDPAEEIETKAALFKLYKSQGNFEKALEIEVDRYAREQEILTNHVKTQSILFNVRFETEQKKQEIELLKTEKELAESKAREQELEIQKAADELAVNEQKRVFQLKLRNLISFALMGFALAIVILIVKMINERKLHKDLRERKKLLDESHVRLVDSNARLEVLNQEKDEILGIVAHDLKNPLSAQMGLGQLLAEENSEMDAAQITEYAQDIVDSSHRMNEIIALLLKINQLEQGSIEVNVKQVKLKTVLEKIISNNRVLLKNKEQELRSEFEEPLPDIQTDPLLMMQVIDNLLSNAVKYSPLRKIICIRVTAEDGQVLISVKDEGPGISKQDQQLLFKKFKTTSNKPTAGESSVGLGLSIVDHLVKLLDGKIWVESEVGKGSEFFVSFPVCHD